MKNRFDLENAISAVYTTAEDLQLVADLMYDGIIDYTEDELMTVLSGIAELHKARCEKVNDVFAQVFQLDQYAKDRCENCWHVNGQHHYNCSNFKVNSGMDGMV